MKDEIELLDAIILLKKERLKFYGGKLMSTDIDRAITRIEDVLFSSFGIYLEGATNEDLKRLISDLEKEEEV